MNVEENRLRTFRGKWPANAAIDPTRLAKAGFYYTGHDLEVQCFFCGTRISDWNYGDHAMVRHRTKAPKCPFVLAPTNTINIPFIPGTVENAAAESPMHQQSSDADHSQRSSSVENNPSLPLRSMDPLKEYGTLVERIVSFQKWPKTTIIHPHKLAMAGFYYLQSEDMVECAFCRGVIMNWKPGDNPDSVHRLNFPNCDFYMKLEPVEELFGFVCVVPESRTNMPGIQVHKTPQRPAFAMYEKRLQTFKGWPKNLKQTPEMLAEAGFYYSGYEDQVRCFHCDGGLRNWQPTDDVWVEHARWFSSCFFVNLVRGQDFVKYCVDNRNFDLSIITGMPEDNATESSVESVSTSQNSKPDDTIASATDIIDTLGASVSTVSQPNEPSTPVDATKTMVACLSTVLQSNVSITNAEVEKLLETAPAKAALEIGLQVDRVKRALKNRMERVGILYTDVAQLIQDVLHHQIMEENNSLDNSTSNSPTSELNNLFNQVTIQMTNNSANKNGTQESDAFERNLEKKKTDNESDDLMALQEENRKLKEARLCKVCMDHELAIVFLPCGHLATCSNCAPVFAKCPLCRFRIHGYRLPAVPAASNSEQPLPAPKKKADRPMLCNTVISSLSELPFMPFTLPTTITLPLPCPRLPRRLVSVESYSLRLCADFVKQFTKDTCRIIGDTSETQHRDAPAVPASSGELHNEEPREPASVFSEGSSATEVSRRGATDSNNTRLIRRKRFLHERMFYLKKMMALDRIRHDNLGTKPYISILTATTVSDDVDYTDYRYEIARLNSFVKWPVSFIDPKKLAAAGFFYTQKKDAVKCFVCQIILSGWMDGDDAKVEHQRWSGKCSFVRNLPCGNVPIGADPSTIPRLLKRIDTCGLYGVKYMPLSGPDTPDHNLQVERAMNSDSVRSISSDLNDDIDIAVFWDADTNAHFTAKLSDVLGSKQPTYASYERRLRSFSMCTFDTICEKKEELAKAGFFYLSGLFGPSDQTMCFYCGKCLRAWERTDDPVEEHIKWYPQCDFIKKVLGKNHLKEKSDLCTERTDHENHLTNATTTVC